MSSLKSLYRDRSGTSAVEFALVLPAFVLMLVGTLWAGELAFAANSLHYAVQVSARCAAVNSTACPDAASTVTYAANQYAGPQISQAFSYNASGCGHTVSATALFDVDIVPGIPSVPLSATSCYP